MQWDAPYRVTRSLNIEIAGRNRLVATHSLSRPPRDLPFDGVPVLVRFGSPNTPRSALTELRREWEVEEDEFERVVDQLLALDFLIAADGRRPPPAAFAGPRRREAGRGFAGLQVHHRMLTDTVRVLSYKEAIFRHCRDRVVVEIGCGSGILSIFAARAGARKVIAVEETEIADLAARMFAANGCAEVVELRRANSRDVILDEPADVILHEIFGIDPFDENLLATLGDARRMLAPGGRFLPRRLQVFCLGLEIAERPLEDPRRLASAADELGRLYGVDLTPYSEAASGGETAARKAMPRFRREPDFLSQALSPESLVGEHDFLDSAADLERQLAAARLKIHRHGTLGGAVVTFRAHLDDEVVLSTSPHAPKTHWGWRILPLPRPLQVAPGDEVELPLELGTELGKQRLRVGEATSTGVGERR